MSPTTRASRLAPPPARLDGVAGRAWGAGRSWQRRACVAAEPRSGYEAGDGAASGSDGRGDRPDRGGDLADGPGHDGSPGVDGGRAGGADVWVGVARVCRDAATVPVDDLDAASVRRAIVEVAAAQRSLVAAGARLARAAEQAQVHRVDGATDTTAWVRELTGSSGRAARAQTMLGRDLEELPRTAEALAQGRIGADQAATIGRAARAGRLGDPGETEARLLPSASQTSETFRRQVRDAEQAADGDLLCRDEHRARAQRRLSVVDHDDGLVDLHARLDRVSAEFVRAGLDAFEVADPADTPVGQRRRPDQRRADALVELARAALAAGTAPRQGGVRPHVSVVIDAAALGDRDGAGGDTAFGGRISTDAVRRLLCDADVTRVVMQGPSQVLDVGRATRTWSPAQRRAVIVRDGRCRGPGCDRPAAWCDVHHIAWWERDRGPTAVTNGLLLCDADHDLVHSGGWTVTLDPDTAQTTWTSPTGHQVVTRPHHQRRGQGAPGRRRPD